MEITLLINMLLFTKRFFMFVSIIKLFNVLYCILRGIFQKHFFIMRVLRIIRRIYVNIKLKYIRKFSVCVIRQNIRCIYNFFLHIIHNKYEFIFFFNFDFNSLFVYDVSVLSYNGFIHVYSIYNFI